jgi:two-component system sensor histidine kinase FlrB
VSKAFVSDLACRQHGARETHRPERPDLDEVLRVMPVGIVVLDVEGKVAFCNPKADSLLNEPLLGQPWRSIIKRAFRPRSDDGHDMSLSDGRRVAVNTHGLEGWPGQLLVLTDVTDTRHLRPSSAAASDSPPSAR